jgi:hypothetical protein
LTGLRQNDNGVLKLVVLKEMLLQQIDQEL